MIRTCLPCVHPVLADRRAGVGGEPLEAGGVGRRGGDDRRVLHRARLLQGGADTGDRGALLADGDVDAAHLLLRVAGRPGVLLVDDRVHADGGLAGLAVTDDQLPLAAADRRHGVDGLDAGLQGLGHRLPLHHRGGLQLQNTALLGLDLAEAVDRGAERVDHPAEEGVADRHREDLAGAPHLLALLDPVVRAEDDRADLALVEVQRHAEHAAPELQQLVGHGRGEALDVGDAVTGVGDGADLFPGRVRLQRGDVARDRTPDLLRGDRQLCHLSISRPAKPLVPPAGGRPVGCPLQVLRVEVSWGGRGGRRPSGPRRCRRSARRRRGRRGRPTGRGRAPPAGRSACRRAGSGSR